MQESKKTMVLTGAGISTGSGIPDFRSPVTGLWEQTDPMTILTKDILMNNPQKFYEHIYSRPQPKTEEVPIPNNGHYILAELEKMGLIDGIITQNVDGLHLKAGSKKVYEVHGNLKDGYCTNCKKYISTKDIRKKVISGQIPPLCDNCGSVVRSSVVLFGDALPESYEIARKEAEESDLIISIGSSLAVSPIKFVTLLPKQFAIINGEKTKMDDKADLIIISEITKALRELINVLKYLN